MRAFSFILIIYSCVFYCLLKSKHERIKNMKKIITYILGLTAITSMFLATGIKEVANWWDIAKPFFIVFIV